MKIKIHYWGKRHKFLNDITEFLSKKYMDYCKVDHINQSEVNGNYFVWLETPGLSSCAIEILNQEPIDIDGAQKLIKMLYGVENE